MPKFAHNEIVVINQYIGDPYNEKGRVNSVNDTHDGSVRYWVVNGNMPFMGTVSDFFEEDELSKA
jgi:hypothetical protein